MRAFMYATGQEKYLRGYVAWGPTIHAGLIRSSKAQAPGGFARGWSGSPGHSPNGQFARESLRCTGHEFDFGFQAIMALKTRF